MSRHARYLRRGKLALAVAVGAMVALIVVVAWTTLMMRSTKPSPFVARPTVIPTKRVSTAIAVVVTPTHSINHAQMISIEAHAYTIQGTMANGKQTHIGACAVSIAQFPLGTILKLYNADKTFNRQCVAEDTGGGIGYGQIDVAMPGDEKGAARWGVRRMWVEVVHKG